MSGLPGSRRAYEKECLHTICACRLRPGGSTAFAGRFAARESVWRGTKSKVGMIGIRYHCQPHRMRHWLTELPMMHPRCHVVLNWITWQWSWTQMGQVVSCDPWMLIMQRMRNVSWRSAGDISVQVVPHFVLGANIMPYQQNILTRALSQGEWMQCWSFVPNAVNPGGSHHSPSAHCQVYQSASGVHGRNKGSNANWSSQMMPTDQMNPLCFQG